jgi:tetratricopeptide (TPR) repeat protein
MDRADYLRQLGDIAATREAEKMADAIEPMTARDHYLLATARSRQGDYEGAVKDLDSALKLDDQHYWSWNQRGICHQEQRKYTLAVRDFSSCISLQRDLPWGYFNLAYALNRSGDKRAAIEAYSQALEKDAHYVPAYVNRGLVQLELGQYAEALADFEQARCLGRQDAPLQAGRGMALEGLQRYSEADEAFSLAFRPMADGTPVSTQMRLAYGFMVSTRLPVSAREAFNEVLSQQPRCLEALYGLAMLEAGQDRVDQAIRYFDRAIEANCLYIDARRYRAVLLARNGRFDQAKVDIDMCLAQNPEGGNNLYAAACVVAHAARHFRDSQAANQALDFLQKAFKHGYGRDRFAQDPDLAGLRNHPDFQELVKKAAGPSMPLSH